MAEREVQSSQGDDGNEFVAAVGGETQLLLGACVLVLIMALVVIIAVRLRSKRRQQSAQVLSPEGAQGDNFSPIAGRLDADLANLYGPSISQPGSPGPHGSTGGSTFGVILPSTSATWMGDGLAPPDHSIHGEPSAFGMAMPPAGYGMPAGMQGFGSMPGIPGVGMSGMARSLSPTELPRTGGSQWVPGVPSQIAMQAQPAVGGTTLIQDVYRWQPEQPQMVPARLEHGRAVPGANDAHFEA